MEAKHRRVGTASTGTAVVVDEEACTATEAVFGLPGKEEKRSLSTRRFAIVRACRFVQRRWADMICVTYYWAGMVGGYWYMKVVLLASPTFAEPLPWLLCLLYYALVLPFGIAWICMVFTGTGSIPKGREYELPPGMIAAMKAGRHNADYKFGPEDAWCTKCDSWKPALVHHCNMCGRCVLWMDHHCYFAGSCIGYLNLRPHLVWLFYGVNMHLVWIILTLLKLISAPPAGRGDWAMWAAWAWFLWGNLATLWNSLSMTLSKLATGWFSWVLLEKFRGIMATATTLKEELHKIARQCAIVDCNADATGAMAGIDEAMKPLVCPGEGLVNGLFRRTAEVAFRESFSWRWLLPWAVGGSCDPLSPTTWVDEDTCKAWDNLAKAMDHGIVVLDGTRAKEAEWKERVNRWGNFPSPGCVTASDVS